MSGSTKAGLRVLVCGGRDFDDREVVFNTLDAMHRMHGISRIIQGGATGADRLAVQWCHSRLVWAENYPADWARHGRAAGPIRNAQMLAEGRPDIVVAFRGGRGTADMLSRARAAGIPVQGGGDVG